VCALEYNNQLDFCLQHYDIQIFVYTLEPFTFAILTQHHNQKLNYAIKFDVT